MKIEYPGHSYFLHTLDPMIGTPQLLVFVQRIGPKYPGNIKHFAGTNLQEVFRACLDRIIYLNKQAPCWQDRVIRIFLGLSIWLLEWRAARRHHRPIPGFTNSIHGLFCPTCGHVGCIGGCHQ